MELKEYTKDDFLKEEIEKELEQALIKIEDAQEKMDNIQHKTLSDKANNNKLTTIILFIKDILDK